MAVHGDIKTHKEYKELERRLKLKDQALEVVKGELERVNKPRPPKGNREGPTRYAKVKTLTSNCLGRIKTYQTSLIQSKGACDLKKLSYNVEKETSEALALKELSNTYELIKKARK